MDYIPLGAIYCREPGIRILMLRSTHTLGTLYNIISYKLYSVRSTSSMFSTASCSLEVYITVPEVFIWHIGIQFENFCPFLSPYTAHIEIQLILSRLNPFCTLRSCISCAHFDIHLPVYVVSVGLSLFIGFPHQNSYKNFISAMCQVSYPSPTS